MVKVTYSWVAVVNKHNTAQVASCCFIIYYRLAMHGNSNIENYVYLKYCLILFCLFWRRKAKQKSRNLTCKIIFIWVTVISIISNSSCYEN